jgi:Ca2+/Na+ antiporter
MDLVALPIVTNLPSTVGGLISAREERSSDMAIGSSFGSNIFSVLIGMGLPWLLTGGVTVLPQSGNQLPKFAIILSVQYLIMTGLLVSWSLTRWVGYSLIFMYTIYIVICIV